MGKNVTIEKMKMIENKMKDDQNSSKWHIFLFPFKHSINFVLYIISNGSKSVTPKNQLCKKLIGSWYRIQFYTNHGQFLYIILYVRI